MIMTKEETQLLIDIKNALSETLAQVKQVYGNSAYWQHLEYKATNDGYENWLLKARQAQENTENYLKTQKL